MKCWHVSAAQQHNIADGRTSYILKTCSLSSKYSWAKPTSSRGPVSRDLLLAIRMGEICERKSGIEGTAPASLVWYDVLTQMMKE